MEKEFKKLAEFILSTIEKHTENVKILREIGKILETRNKDLTSDFNEVWNAFPSLGSLGSVCYKLDAPAEYVKVRFETSYLAFVEEKHKVDEVCIGSNSIAFYMGRGTGNRTKVDELILLTQKSVKTTMNYWFTLARNAKLVNRVLEEMRNYFEKKRKEAADFVDTIKYVVTMLKLRQGL